jgi:hypothetical protein
LKVFGSTRKRLEGEEDVGELVPVVVRERIFMDLVSILIAIVLKSSPDA